MFYGRGKNRIQDPYTIADTYKKYKEDKDTGSPYDVSYKVYKAIVTGYLKYCAQRVLDGFKVKMPHNLGTFQIIKKKMNFKSNMQYKRNINWKETQKLGKIVYHYNPHTSGYKYLFYWDRNAGNKARNILKYRFVPTRTIKRELARLIKEEKRDYFEV